MKSIQLALGLLFISAAAVAQSKRVYTDEGFDTKKVEKFYSIESPGQQFCSRMAALYKVSDSGHITQGDYNRFLMDFDNMVRNMGSSGNVSIPPKLVSMSNILNEINDVAYNIDGHRDAIYHLASPVYKAATENWGDEVLNMTIANSYFNLREYVVSMANDVKLSRALAVIDRNPVGFGANAPSCDYAVSIAPNASKDKIDIYFSNIGLYYKAAKKHPANLLSGPIIGWEGYKDESESVMNILKTYADMNNNSAVYIQPAENKTSKKTIIKTDLNSDMKWFVWVFKNNKLYYSYMVEPCSEVSRCSIN